MAITGLTDKEENIFYIEEKSTTIKNSLFNFRYGHFYRMNYAVKTIERSNYNLLMLLGDVGGLYGLLFSVFATLNNVLNFQKAENFLVQSLYKDNKSMMNKNTVEAKKQSAFKEYL